MHGSEHTAVLMDQSCHISYRQKNRIKRKEKERENFLDGCNPYFSHPDSGMVHHEWTME